MSSHVNSTMAILCSGAGCYAYMRRGSLPSLVASLAFAGMYGFSAYLIQTNQNAAMGHSIGMFASAAFFGVMGSRVGKKGLWKQPANIPFVLTTCSAACFGYNLYKWRQYTAPAELDDDQFDKSTVKVTH